MRIKLDHFDMVRIAKSGQCFRWVVEDKDLVSLIAFGKYLRIRKVGDELDFSCTGEEWESIWADYFDLPTDYNEIEHKIRDYREPHLLEAFELGQGIRILQQDLWEIIVSFIISQNNNITRITRTIDGFCERAGLEIEGHPGKYRFPNPGEIDLDIFADRTLGFGYRADYLRKIYEFGADNPEWLSELKAMDYKAARESLLQRTGIGPKVADCICLFGLHHIEAFPIDTHVKQLLEKYYAEGFPFEFFDGVAGIIQQYLFYYELNNN